MPSFILRDLNPEFWARVQAKATAEGTTVKAVILRLLSQWLAVGVLVALSAACGYRTPSSPSPIVVVPSASPASLQLLAATRQDLSIELAAKVLTSEGRAVPGVAVTFTSSTGVLSTDVATTDSTGHARTILTSSETAFVTASTGTLSASTVLTSSVSAVVVPAPPVYPPAPPPGPPSNPGPPAPPPPAPDPPAPAAGFVANVGCTPGTTVSPTVCNVGASYNGTPVPASSLTTAWEWGDGGISGSAVTPLGSHSYTQRGGFLVVVQVSATVNGVTQSTTTSKAVSIP